MEPRESGADGSPRAGSLTIEERLQGFYTRHPAVTAFLITLFIVLFLLLPLWWMAGTWYEEQLITEERNVVAVDLSKYGSQLSQALSRRVSLVEGLSAYVLSDPSQETLTRTYDSFAAGLYTATPGIRNFGVAPGGIQTYVYPLKGNENVPGHNLLTDNRSYVQKYNNIAIETKKIVIHGPHELRQGGLGLVITDALFVNNTFWGFSSMVVDMPPILAEAGLSGQTGSLTLAVKNHDGTVFYGDPGLFAGDAVIQQFPVGTGTWEIGGMPAGGWSAPIQRPLLLFYITGLVILGLIAGLVFLITKTYISVIIDITERKKDELELQNSLSFLNSLVDQSPLPMWISDEKGTLIRINQACCDLLKITPADVVGKYNVLGDNLVLEQGFLPIVQDVFLKGQPANFQITYDTRKLKTLVLDRQASVILDVTIFPVKDASGKITNAVIQHIDITKRKHAEEELRESELRFFTVFQASPIAISITRLSDGKTIDVNPAFLRLFGYTREEVVGHTTLELNVWGNPKDRDHIVQLLRKEGKVRDYETQFRKRSGEIGTLIVSADVIDLAGDKYLLSLLQDITDRKRAADALKESRVQLAEAMDLAHLVNWEFDVATGIFTFDDRFYALYGTTAEREGGNKIPAEVYAREFVHPDDQHVVADEVKKAIEATDPGFTSQVEHRIIRRDGVVRHIVVRFGITKDANGRTIKTHGANQDITERKLMEEEIRSLNKTLEQRVMERTEKLNASLEEKVLLLREIHHRVKNNLQIIISLLNLQSRYIEDEKISQVIKESQNRIRAMALVHEKLYQSTDIAGIDLDNYCRFLGDSLFRFYGMSQKGIILNIRIHDINVDINTAIPVGLIVNELVSNSLKHAFPDGRKGEISIAIQRQDHTLTLIYKDDGVGIPDNFDWRNAKSLGLRLVISLVEQLSGTIELDRTAGTAFTIVVKEKE
ncbi:MAG: PAS domain S-box protein [Methanoregula sp.]|nr:MAG: PAS domain S-box protein [Methanoregula sp.]